MKAFISVEEFLSLSKGDKLCGHGETFEIETANCGGGQENIQLILLQEK